MDTRKIATKLFDQMQATARSYEKFGMELEPVMKASLDEIEQHIIWCGEASQEYKLASFDYTKAKFGLPRDEIFALAAAKKKASNRGAGARALARKYGKDAAEEIIRKKDRQELRSERVEIMKNKFAGKCQHCGAMVAAGEGNLEKRDGQWVVTHDGPCPDIESGLGIGGAGSDDYNIGTEYVPSKIIGSGKGFGAHGRRYDEECECCHELSDVVCNWCGCCEKCCVC